MTLKMKPKCSDFDIDVIARGIPGTVTHTYLWEISRDEKVIRRGYRSSRSDAGKDARLVRKEIVKEEIGRHND